MYVEHAHRSDQVINGSLVGLLAFRPMSTWPDRIAADHTNRLWYLTRRWPGGWWTPSGHLFIILLVASWPSPSTRRAHVIPRSGVPIAARSKPYRRTLYPAIHPSTIHDPLSTIHGPWSFVPNRKGVKEVVRKVIPYQVSKEWISPRARDFSFSISFFGFLLCQCPWRLSNEQINTQHKLLL